MGNLTNTMKSAARRSLAAIARPIWRRVWARIETRIDTRISLENAKLQQLVHETGSLSAAWHQHVPAMLNVAASVGAIAREQARMKRALQVDGGKAVSGDEANRLWDSVGRVNKEHAEIWKRIEFVRSELLYEMRYGAKAAVPGRDASHEATPARIVDRDKVEHARKEGLRLNLGCGHVPLDGYVNVDMRDLPGVDVVARVDALPFEPGEVSEIFSSHVLEHFTQTEFERKLLPYWVGLLAPGGMFRAIVPDAAAMIRAASEGRYPFDDFRKVFFGGQDYDGDFHFNMFCAESLGDELRRAGLTQVEVVAQGRKNDIAIELEIVARKPAN